MPAHLRQITLQPVVINEKILPSQINFGNIQVLNHYQKNEIDWFIHLLKTDEKNNPRFQKMIHTDEIINGGECIYDAYNATKKSGKELALNAQALLGFCFLMKERERSQKDNVYYSILAEEKNLLFAKIEINDKIKIQTFPYGKNFLNKEKEKRNLLLRVM